LRTRRFVPLCALALLLLASSAPRAFAQANAGCTVTPVPGFAGVFTQDDVFTDQGRVCGPGGWPAALVILRGQANAGEGENLNNLYLNGGGSMPQYVLVAVESCRFCGPHRVATFSVLVTGKRSGEFWNTAVTAAHALQKSKPLPPGDPDWEFMGMEPQPVSPACLEALPGEPCWGTDPFNVNWYQPAASSPAPASSAPAPTLSAPAPSPSAPAGPTPGAASMPNISGFVGVWSAHQTRLEVHADGSASAAFFPTTAPSLELTLQFTSATPTVATLEVVASDSPDHTVGETWTLTLNDNDTLTPTIDGVDGVGFDFCGPQAPAGWCGA
jgi:hypothetical protein